MVYNIIIGRDEADRKKFGERGTVFIGRSYVKMGQLTSLSNNVYLDVARPHVIMISGKRGSGKCLSGDTKIQLEDGSLTEIEKLKDNNQKILSLNEKLKITETEKIDFFEREVYQLLRIKLRSGKEIKLTPEHPLLTMGGWKEAQSLFIGSRIATPRIIPVFGNVALEDHKIKLLAYLIAEGHTGKVVLFSNTDKEIVEEFKDCLNRLDNALELRKEKEGHYRITIPNWKNEMKSSQWIVRDKLGKFKKGSRIELKKRTIRTFIEKYNLFNKLSKEKEIPLEVTRLPKEKLSIFLNRLFSCDGSIYSVNNYWEISYSSSSEKLIRTVQNLILRFGVLSKLRNKKINYREKQFNSFELVIGSENVKRFIENIGFFGKKKEREPMALEYFETTERNPNIDTIPKEIWQTYKPDNWAKIGRGFGYAYPKAMRERMRYAPSRQTLLQIATIDQNNALKTLAESDIFWDEIASLESLEGKFKVYDFCVPESHNFIANDIIVHNSFSLGVIAEEMSQLPQELKERISVLIFDTMGIFWTMKYQNEKEIDLLNKWNIKPKALDVKIYTPEGSFEKYKSQGFPTDYSFTIKTSELGANDWTDIFEIILTEPIGILIERIISQFQEENKDYDIEDIVKRIQEDTKSEKSIKDAAENRFLAAKSFGLFSKKGTEIKDIVKPGQVSIIDTSAYSGSGSWNVKNLVIGLICKKLLAERILIRKLEELAIINEKLIERETEKMPLVWIFIDEAHSALPKEYKTPATDALVQLLREGRQPGISLVLATQQPGKIHEDVLTQSDIVISHRITSKIDIEALNSMMQTYLISDLQRYLNDLPKLKGSAIILDDNSERIYPARIRPRFTWHGGESPAAIKEEKYEEELEF